MDWDKAIEINRVALQRIVAELIAMVGLAVPGPQARVPRAVWRAVLEVLRPAESAVRRLIIIAAHRLGAELQVKARAVRPLPAGLSLSRAKPSQVSFQLHDPRKRFDLQGRWRGGTRFNPRVSVIGFDPTAPVFRAAGVPPAASPEALDDSISAERLGHRLTAIQSALADLPKQARRFVRWQARRMLMTAPKFRTPLRPGRPPGYRRVSRHPVDDVLRECHGLVRDLRPPDTS
jgi:hypothetical protein